jgi:hypothetical protein
MMQVLIGGKDRGRILTALVEQHQAFTAQPQRVQEAQTRWRYSCRNDFAYAERFGLTSEEKHDLLGWISNQRDYARLCKTLGDDMKAHYQARDNFALLKSSQRPVKGRYLDHASITLFGDNRKLKPY